MASPAILLIAVAAVLQSSSPPPSWTSYSPAKGGYTVSLPARPTEKKQPLALPAGENRP